jgi:GrpB-like predicted nucleotidyltransferase (UPF0157 family)
VSQERDRPDAITHADGSLTVLLSPYDPTWPARFAAVAAGLRDAIGAGPAIHHVGSTAVPGLAAKPRIDIQVSVPPGGDLDEVTALLAAGTALRVVADVGDGRKRLLVADEPVAVNVHVRWAGEFSQQAALLLRDYLRADAAAVARYRSVKDHLAARRWVSVDAYADAKGDVVWALLRAADGWAAATGWRAGPSDA